ncbi:MAG: tRNA (adenosine(37)-N6)-dimethylallyltransferase MiaA [Candidatus Daviesbacteria bacterium]|nr:tRNA (adenosine(37)-N6)-dimethylallyltransferase MiaA [Candidatus Daviesbacteria bacterium]
MLSRKNKLLAILGPTATGKTDIALFLAKKFNGELVSCDSRQVYIGLDIGTGKMPKLESRIKNQELRLKKEKGFWEIDGIKVWMYDVVSTKYQYTVADYVKDADKAIENILERGKLPIVVGGTGFYLKALLDGLSNLSIPVDKNLRKQLETLSLIDLQNKLQETSPQRWKKMNYSDRQNPRRLVRAIELMLSSLRRLVSRSGQGSNKQLLGRNWIPVYARLAGASAKRAGMTSFNILKIGLIAPRDMLYRRVDERVVSRIKQGMVEEAKRLYENGLTVERMKQLGLEYGVLADYLDGKIKTRDELIQIVQNKIHRFVRRQLTWFKKEKDMKWFDLTDKNYSSKVENFVSRWYDNEIEDRNGQIGKLNKITV